MATTLTVNDPASKLWNQQLAELQSRYKHVRPAIVAALCVLHEDPDASVDDAKARAAEHGVRITAASVNAAQRLLARQDGAPATNAAEPKAAAPAKPTRERRPRANDGAVDAEALIRQVVGKLQNQGNAEAERLRGVMRRVIDIMQAAVG
jgi:hypothetical protein